MFQIQQPDAAKLVAGLTRRELELLELMARGQSNAAICEDLYLSPKTVETHVRNVFHKFGLPQNSYSHRRVAAVLVYLEAVEHAQLRLAA